MTDRAPFGRRTLAEFRRAYRGGERTPSEVADACAAAIRASDEDDPPLRSVITPMDDRARREAEASTSRWKLGAPRSPLDGVPLVVKDNIHAAGVRTTNGTVIDFPIPTRDAWVLDKLREAGAVIVGKANQHEIGAGTTGINPHHGTPRNPFDPGRWCGGSSSGSACAVSAGLVPVAIGTDAGGSVRMPSSFVGAVGLKPTFGRVSRVGMSVLCDTVDHIGPIAASARDAAACLVAIAGANDDDEESWDQPPLPDFERADAEVTRPVAGLTIGLARATLDAPWMDPPVARAIEASADALAEAGATIVDVELPDLDESRVAGLVILGAEGPSGLEHFLEAHHDKLAVDLQVLLAIGDHFSARDYLKAQRVRHQVRKVWSELFSSVDLVLMPTTGTVAGPIHEDALQTGEVDETVSHKAITCTFPSNLTGFPAVSVPCGMVEGLPVGAQLVAPPWEELRCLRGAAAIEAAGLVPDAPPVRSFGDRLL